MKKLCNKKFLGGMALVLVFSITIALMGVVSKANDYDEDMMRGRQRRVAMTVTDAEYRLFASIVYCEAGGEQYAGQLGVANVILNRVQSDAWPNSLYDVIYQKNQFSPVRNGYLNRVLAEYDQGKFNSDKWHKSVLKAVDDALAGKNNIGNREYFMTPAAYASNVGSKGYDKLTIGNAVFFNCNW